MRPTNGILVRVNEDTDTGTVRVYRAGVLRWEGTLVLYTPLEWRAYHGRHNTLLAKGEGRAEVLGELVRIAEHLASALRVLAPRTPDDPAAAREVDALLGVMGVLA